MRHLRKRTSLYRERTVRKTVSEFLPWISFPATSNSCPLSPDYKPTCNSVSVTARVQVQRLVRQQVRMGSQNLHGSAGHASPKSGGSKRSNALRGTATVRIDAKEAEAPDRKLLARYPRCAFLRKDEVGTNVRPLPQRQSEHHPGDLPHRTPNRIPICSKRSWPKAQSGLFGPIPGP